jgi:hyperosmotically inducible protein
MGQACRRDLQQIEGNHGECVGKVQEWSGERTPDKGSLNNSTMKNLRQHFRIQLRRSMNTRYVLTLCTAVVIGGALLAGSAQAVSKTDEKTAMNDSWITAKTKIALFADSRVKGSEIKIETTQGLVMIRGKVDSDAVKQTAEGIAKGIDGVKSVKNELQVVAPSKREAMDDKDDAITARVNEQIAKDSHLKKAGIHAQTNAGVVSLTGEVQDLMTSAQASWTAWQVPGVKSVKNDLTVKEKA